MRMLRRAAMPLMVVAILAVSLMGRGLFVAPVDAQPVQTLYRGAVENTAYVAGNDAFASNLTFQPRSGIVRITVAYSAAATIYFRLVGDATTNISLNSGVALTADSMYVFDVPLRAVVNSQDIAYNVQFSGNGTIRWLLVEEISE